MSSLSTRTLSRLFRTCLFRAQCYRSRYKVEIFIFAVAFFIRALYAIAVQLSAGAHGFIAFSDADIFYNRIACNLIQHHVFSLSTSAPFYLDTFHTPLYPLFIAAFYWLNIPILWVVLVQDVFAALMCVLIYRVGMELTSSAPIAILAGAIASVEPMSIYWSGLLMSDVLFAFGVTLSVYLLARQRTGLSAFVLGVSALLRPIALFFLPPYIFFFPSPFYRPPLAKPLPPP